MANNKGVSSYTHTRTQLNNYSNQFNPNNSAHKANLNNHSNQKNPNNCSYKQSRIGNNKNSK